MSENQVAVKSVDDDMLKISDSRKVMTFGRGLNGFPVNFTIEGWDYLLEHLDEFKAKVEEIRPSLMTTNERKFARKAEREEEKALEKAKRLEEAKARLAPVIPIRPQVDPNVVIALSNNPVALAAYLKSVA